ncbi:hypothetical protein [Rufibacter sp. XAAS-G3-1]|nr:hypothetical protein [Rufibacter sp. XAAS-G3-1]
MAAQNSSPFHGEEINSKWGLFTTRTGDPEVERELKNLKNTGYFFDYR